MDSEPRKTKKKRPVLQKTGKASSKKSKQNPLKSDDSFSHLPLPEEDERDQYMTLGDHLEELRKRIIYVVLVLLISSITVGIFSSEVHHFLTAPFFELDFSSDTSTENSIESRPLLTLGNFYGPLEVMIRLSISIGFVVSFPIILLIFWGFVTPAVSRKAAIIGRVTVGASSILFWSGMYFCWYYVFPISAQYMLIGILPEGTMPWVPLEKYYSFLLMLHAGSGLLFQFPLLFVILGAIGILPLSWHKRVWKYMIAALFVVAALMTPPDPISQVLFTIPLTALYAVALMLIWIIEKGKRTVSSEDDAG